ncbi:hypothetical protein H7U22_02405 [Pedobacter sp. CCM 8938]|uniref:Uncharacterized protein n=1 Tax=Pedobacter fastidiosus TaxID=2765361 RepID=A0ABR7KMF8_9SPHI|nr:hypothetical protein [Pedobacter fastidiosus]MBC6109263.1 hypothetical protein [Pedobacter fastidiosus]
MLNKKAPELIESSLTAYIGGIFFVVSGGIFVVVSGGVVVLVVSAGVVIVESILVLSVEPAMFLDELHAEVAIIREPAKARLKIIFFIVFLLLSIILTTLLSFGFNFFIQNFEKLLIELINFAS